MKAPQCLSLSRVSRAARGRLRRATACALTTLLLCNAALGAAKVQAARKPAPKVADARATEAKTGDDGRVSFKLTIKGEGFGRAADAVTLALLNTDGEDAVEGEETAVESVTPTKIVAQVVAKPGPYSLRLRIGQAAADTSEIGPLAVAPAAQETAAGAARAAAPPREPEGIDIEEPEVFAHPSDGGQKRYTVVVKWKGGDFFGTDPRLVSLVLTPAVASDVTVRRVTPTRIEADFWAADKYQVKDVSVSVHDHDNPGQVVASSDIEAPSKAEAETANGGKPRPAALGATDDKEKGKDEQPKITSTAVVFLQRAYGIGRLKIEGKGFGDYKAPPVSAEDYLLCFEPLARQALYKALEDGGHPDRARQQAFEDQRCSLLAKTAKDWQDWRARQIEPLVKVALVPKNTDLRIEQTKILYVDDTLIDVYFEFNRYYRNSEPLRLASATVTVKKPKSPDKPKETKPAAPGGREVASAAHGANGASVVNASVLGPNAAGVEKKDEAKKGDDSKETVCDSGNCKTYIATNEVGGEPGLEYTYNVLDNASAAMLFGKGVAGNFYAIQLSVTNNGDRKVSIPLSSIKAEIEWAYGYSEEKSGKGGGKPSGQKAGEKVSATGASGARAFVTPAEMASGTPAEIPSTPSPMAFYYEEGPVTLSPLSLQTVTAFFDGNEKVNGVKAKVFNYFDGAAIFGLSLAPFFGPGFRSAHGAFTGGLVPGLKRGLGDLSGQQLQNLTGMSWQDIEVVGAKGGSVVKYIFIQRGDSNFNDSVKKTIKNIQGMEVKGIEVVEGETKLATHTGQQ